MPRPPFFFQEHIWAFKDEMSVVSSKGEAHFDIFGPDTCYVISDLGGCIGGNFDGIGGNVDYCYSRYLHVGRPTVGGNEANTNVYTRNNTHKSMFEM